MSSNEKKDFIPFALPCIGEEEVSAAAETVRSGWLTTGPKTKLFEEKFATAVGAKHALAVNSATGGLHLAMEAIGTEQDDLVLTPVWTFTSTAEVTRYLGGHPVFIDSDPASLNIDVDKLEAKLEQLRKENARIKAVMPVHFAGQACDMQRILALAEKYEIKIIEDAAHTFPTTVKSGTVTESEIRTRQIGAIGHATVFSFYATKTIATGEGGMVTTEDENVAERIRTMRLHGINRDVWKRYASDKPSWYYEVVEPGFKYNMTDIAASIGLCQLEKARKFHERRAYIAAEYDRAFANSDFLEIPRKTSPDDVHSWHLYVLRLNSDRLSINRDEFIQKMSEKGVGCSVHFIPLHMQPYWKNRYDLTEGMFPEASKQFKRVVSLPIYPSMTDGQVARVIESVLSIIGQNKKANP